MIRTNQTFIIPFRLPGLNEVIAKNRTNRYAGAKLKGDTETAIMASIAAYHLLPVKLPCIVHMLFEEPTRKRDADNVESAKKFVMDALVKSGVLQGDSPKYVVGSPSFTRYNTQCGHRVLVTIIEDANEDRLRTKLHNASETITEDDE